MADEDLRTLEREADGTDPAARERHQARLCRTGQHTWNRYKGGDHVCRVCGRVKAGKPRELGNMTLTGCPFEFEQLLAWWDQQG